MVHNGIEYAIMAAYAEGLNILKHADVGMHMEDIDAETTPLREPSTTSTRSTPPTWPRCGAGGQVVASWLLDLTAHALA